MKAVLFAGGWEGHSPIAFSNWCKKLLEDNNVEVEVFKTLEPLKKPEKFGGCGFNYTNLVKCSLLSPT